MLKQTILCLFAFMVLPVCGRAASTPIWAKRAVRFQFDCLGSTTPSQRIVSPDGRIEIQLKCHPSKESADPVMYLHISEGKLFLGDIDLEERTQELLWSPDSKAFLVNGSESAYAGFFVKVYKVEDHQVRELKVTQAAQCDMVTAFPPCKAKSLDAKECKGLEKDPEYNVSGLEWVNGSDSIIVIAEVPCSSAYGGIMCQIHGYRLEVASGKILVRMTARELKQQWQHSMAWTMRIPDPPVYEAPMGQP